MTVFEARVPDFSTRQVKTLGARFDWEIVGQYYGTSLSIAPWPKDRKSIRLLSDVIGVERDYLPSFSQPQTWYSLNIIRSKP